MAKWNDKQQKVIDSRKLSGQILISAAAGSGKTAVLVERILRSILDKTDGEYVNNIDDFLVVTFTRAAAAQMKDKISNKITELLNEEAGKEFPDKELVDHLLKQQVSVGRADICTLDSFSAKVVRENFNVIGIDPSFVTADANLMKLLKDDILSEMFDELFSGKDGRYVSSADFCELASFFFRKTDDTDLKNACLKIMRVAETMPEPEPPLGDMDGDELLTAWDAPLLFTTVSAAAEAPDLNGDGCANSRDALLLFRRTAR